MRKPDSFSWAQYYGMWLIIIGLVSVLILPLVTSYTRAEATYETLLFVGISIMGLEIWRQSR
jgi:hypothetical protein